MKQIEILESKVKNVLTDLVNDFLSSLGNETVSSSCPSDTAVLHYQVTDSGYYSCMIEYFEL